MTFWIAAALMTLALAGLLLWTLMRRGASARSTAEADIAVYRDQLAEVERDVARGTIGAAEADRSRVEISRRILEADRDVIGGVGRAVTGGPAVLPVIFVMALLAGSFGLYWRLGAPGYPDLPMSERLAQAASERADRPSQAEAEAKTTLPPRPGPDAKYAELMERLRKAVAEKPDDVTGQQLLARNEAALGNYDAAAKAQQKIIALRGAAATAEDYAGLADLYVLATGGYVSPEAETAAGESLARDPKNGTARFYLGLMWAQTGRPDLAFRFWRGLLEEGPEEAPWIAPIREQIGMLASAAGVDYAPPAPAGALKGPTAGDMAAAADMSAEDRMGMIKGMVAQLSERLFTDGGSVEEWSRLISSLGVLGEKDRAKEAWVKAQKAFEGKEAELETLRQVAEQAGVAG
jgi:cytochrome c-type biogenesis protein CcmH